MGGQIWVEKSTGKMRAANESYALKMNTIVILLLSSYEIWFKAGGGGGGGDFKTLSMVLRLKLEGLTKE